MCFSAATQKSDTGTSYPAPSIPPSHTSGPSLLSNKELLSKITTLANKPLLSRYHWDNLFPPKRAIRKQNCESRSLFQQMCTNLGNVVQQTIKGSGEEVGGWTCRTEDVHDQLCRVYNERRLLHEDLLSSPSEVRQMGDLETHLAELDDLIPAAQVAAFSYVVGPQR